MQTRGVLIASDANLEWMLPWWWDRYSRHNQDPVLCIDLGMSQTAALWWKERGLYLRPSLHHFDPTSIPTKRRKAWEKSYPGISWKKRAIWMQKPFIMGLSPFETTLWLDIDCEVRGSLHPLFNTLLFHAEFAIAPDPLEPDMYNSGVIVMKQNSHLLKLWQQTIIDRHEEFLGDQQVLSHLIQTEKPLFFPLPSIYNWSAQHTLSNDILIRHFHGTFLKMALLMSLDPLLGNTPQLPPSFTPHLI